MSQIEQIDRVEAMRRAETIRSGMVGYAMAMQAIGEAYEARDWVALGHKDWDTYCEKEFSEKRLKLTRDQREQAVLAFRGAGMSIRAIGSVLGVSPGTVHGDLAGVQDRTPDTVTGADGKSYAASRPAVSSDSPKTPSGGVPEEGAPVSGAPAGPVAVPAEDGSGTQSTPADPPTPSDADGDTKGPVRAGADVGQPEQDHRDANPGEADGGGRLDGDPSAAVGAPTPAATQTDPAEGSPQDSAGSVDGREQQGPTGVSSPAAPVPVPSWLVAITNVITAVHDLDEEDPNPAAVGAEDDLAAELGSAVSMLTRWYRRMHEARL